MDQGSLLHPALSHAYVVTADVRPKGGADVWGNLTHAADDISDAVHTHGELISFRNALTTKDTDSNMRNMTADEAGTWILEHTPSYFQVRGGLAVLEYRKWAC